MESPQAWKEVFVNWPADLPRRGVLVTNFGEQVLFSGFLTSSSLLLIERNAPDTIGARKVLVPYEGIQGLKIVDVVKGKAFKLLGFEGSLNDR